MNILKRLFRKSYRAELRRENQRGYDLGCIDGYRRCEERMTDIITICKRDAIRGARLKMLSEMLEREDKAYAEGLAHRELLNQTKH